MISVESSADPKNLRVLVCAPIGRDSALTVELLTRAAIPCHACESVAEVCRAIDEGAAAVLLTEEVLADPEIDRLAEALHAQPPWSDISVLLFAGSSRDDVPLRTLHKLEVLRNVTLLDRPIRTSAVLSTVRAALRGRQRQYELRDVLVALHRARTDAEHANRLKDEFLATVSHELRTPLNAIMGWVSMLRQARIEPDRVDKVLDIVERNARAQAQLISDILDISRMITGGLKLKPETIALRDVVLDALDTVRPAAEAKKITLSADLPEGALVNGDAERLQQVFWNVLSNACKFTPPEGRIDVVLRVEGPWVSLRVADTGAGIHPDFLPVVFDRFRQADQTITRSHGGLGLGLAIVKHLVEVHGGDVSASSDGPNRGASFEIRLPAARTRRPSPDVPARARRREDVKPPATFADQLVLVVDDDESTRGVLSAVLCAHGARVVAVESAASAVAALDDDIPALIVADIGMPREDGLSMMRRIRQRPEAGGGAVPALALSAYARAEDRQAALEAGFDEFLAKPAIPADVVRAAERLLPRARTLSA